RRSRFQRNRHRRGIYLAEQIVGQVMEPAGELERECIEGLGAEDLNGLFKQERDPNARDRPWTLKARPAEQTPGIAAAEDALELCDRAAGPRGLDQAPRLAPPGLGVRGAE